MRSYAIVLLHAAAELKHRTSDTYFLPASK